MRLYTPALNPSGAQPREIAERVNALLRGKLNSLGIVTLTVSSATTVLQDPNIGLDSMIILMPKTANAKAEGIPWQAVTAAGSVTLNHANNAQADRTYAYVILG